MESYLSSVRKQFEYYRSFGHKTFAQLTSEEILWQYNESSNSIAIVVNHLHGNMLSRWTDFLTSDGEKSWRNRDLEFDNEIKTKNELLEKWNEGWDCLFSAVTPLIDEDLNKEIFIRNMGHTVTEAINRQLSHYAYHVGQLVFIAKMIKDSEWQTLSIAKGNSADYYSEKFSKPKRKEHFTDDL